MKTGGQDFCAYIQTAVPSNGKGGGWGGVTWRAKRPILHKERIQMIKVPAWGREIKRNRLPANPMKGRLSLNSGQNAKKRWTGCPGDCQESGETKNCAGDPNENASRSHPWGQAGGQENGKAKFENETKNESNKKDSSKKFFPRNN